MDPTDLGATIVVAPGLMLDNLLPIPNAESLSFYPSVLKLVAHARARVSPGAREALVVVGGVDEAVVWQAVCDCV